jgi:hypothetical protein
MTIQLQLSPELERHARACAQEEFQGDVSAFVNSLLRLHKEALEHEAEVDKKLLEALDSPTRPMTDEFWTRLRQHIHTASQTA